MSLSPQTEGIDASQLYDEHDLEDLFDAATAFVAAAAVNSKLDDTVALRLYGLYKQATCGACDTPRPSFLDFRRRKKWYESLQSNSIPITRPSLPTAAD